MSERSERNGWLSGVAAAAAVVVLAACGGTADRPAPAAQPQRIVALNGDIAEIVYALGLGDQVVGTDTSALYPPEAQQTPKIGYQRQLSAEGILSLRPTIVVGTAEAGPPEVLDQVRNTGVRVEITPTPTTLDSVPQRIRTVAGILGVDGGALASTVEKEVAAARTAVPAAAGPRVAFLYLRGTGTTMLGGIGSRADAMIAGAGAVDAGTAAGVRGFKPITPEALAVAKPDVLLLLDGGLASVGGVDGVLRLPGVAQTPAGAQRRIVSLEDTYLLAMGPRTGGALRDLIGKLYP